MPSKPLASPTIPGGVPAGRRATGFTLIELVVALGVAALLAGVATPMAVRMYDSMQYREALRGLSTAASGARYRAITSGRAFDLMVEADASRYTVVPAQTAFDKGKINNIAADLRVQMVSARQLSSQAGVGVIRFYPDGSSTGGSITLWRTNGDGLRLRVDWLLGRITQERPEL